MTNQHQQPRAVAILVLATCFAALLAFASADCSVRIEQTLGSSWVADGVPTSQWNARIVSTGSETVTSLQLAIGGANPINQLWELDPVPGANRLYALPAYVSGLSTGQVYNWGYIWQSAAQAPVSVSSIQCGGGPAPSASSSPAAASPSASPSIVATPAPCQLSILQSTRGAGGSWTEGDRFFQIYDLNLLNSGSSAITAAVIAIDLAPNQQQTITQFWNLERQSATSNLFNVRNPGGNIEVGATLGAGIVVSSPISAGPQVPPTTRVVSVSCVGGSPQPSAPASPSPSSGASPSATPASGCRAQLAIVARSAAAGGSWTTGPNQFFQIFDIQITNNGQRPVNGGVITFNLPVAGSTITQWWELNRQGSTNVFNVAFNYGPLQVGASQGAGIVVETSSPSQAVPSALLSNIACA